MTKVEQLRAQLTTKQAETAAVVSEAIEVAKLTAKLSMLDNTKLQTARVHASIKKDTTSKLEKLDAMCAEVVTAMPIFNKTTKENRKWNPSRSYGLGNQLAILTGILSGIQYSANEHKVQMLAITGLDADIIESTLEAFGSPAYYSKNYGVVVEEVPYDLPTIEANLAIIEDALDINLDKSRLTAAIMDNRFKSAKASAERAQDKVERTIAQAQTTFVA